MSTQSIFVKREWLCLRQPLAVCIRWSSTCGGDKKKDNDRCGAKFKDFPCGKPEAYVERNLEKPKEKSKKEKSMWPNPFCDDDDITCPVNPRFDDLYYIESDKAKRKYWQTWVACPPLQIKEKKICCFEKSESPPIQRRHLNKPATACVMAPVCPEPSFEKCPRAKRRCHKAGRIPPSCNRVKTPRDCTKPVAPYPAFSECVRLKPDALPLSECTCWQKPALCEAWAEWKRRNSAKKIK